jgi:hypothetical protein
MVWTCHCMDRPSVRGRSRWYSMSLWATTRPSSTGCRPGNTRPGRRRNADHLRFDPGGANVVDEPVRLAILPELWTGWVGRLD